ncbi:PREDICTED: uncharacterized protein LOC104729276 [Camelina sativa]|uniref:Uncharacterized protein LOC104729276 n=1 Tax=Camelina sativa TaxID=90675 RepID=A0ABM0UUE4_CAMSA|nr:PREDICTED: uncharacterized protein LOC104729276 [Camelina sativa]
METKVVKEDDTPLRGIFCLKRRQDMKRFEETEDCFILEFDPFDSFDVKRLTFTDDDREGGDKDLAIIHETGQVACRDYPHPRHLCLKFPFESTPKSSDCDLCYCYICDKPAPCAEWIVSRSQNWHCTAYDSALWNSLRRK